MGDLQHLLGVASLVGSDKFEPAVGIQHAEEWVKPEIRREIARGCFFEERNGSFANRAQGGERRFFGVKELRVERDGCLAPEEAGFDDSERNMKAPQERNGLGRVADDAVGGAGNGALDLAEMGDDFCGGPTAVGRAGPPEVEGDEVGGAEKRRLGTGELLYDAG